MKKVILATTLTLSSILSAEYLMKSNTGVASGDFTTGGSQSSVTYAVLVRNASYGTLSENDLRWTSSGYYHSINANVTKNTGKFYFEGYAEYFSQDFLIGVDNTPVTSLNTFAGNTPYSYTYEGVIGSIYNNGGSGYGGGAYSAYSAGDIIGIAVDTDNNRMYVSKNGVWQNGHDPANGLNGIQTTNVTDDHSFMFSAGSGGVWYANFGQDSTFGNQVSAGNNQASNGQGDFKYQPPTGYLPLTQ